MPLTMECPACKDGRHERCIGQPLSEEQAPLPGMWRDCSCANRDHLTVNQWIDRQGVLRAGKTIPAVEPVHEMVQPGLLGNPILPYAGTSGYSGSDTSEERARTEDANGTTADRQAEVLRILGNCHRTGLTVSELRTRKGWHHGQASSTLSVLHKEGLIERLTERRDRCKVYVLPEYVDGRETEQHGRQKPTRTLAQQEARDRLRDYLGFRAANMNANSVRTTYEQATMLGDLTELLEEQ